MRSIWLVVSIVVVLVADLEAQWRNVAPNLMTGNDHRIGWGGAMTYHDGVLWVAVTHQLCQSPDSGKTWKVVQTPVSNQSNLIIYDIDFFDKSHGVIAAGEHGLLLTSDGGLNWVQLLPPWFSGGLSIINQAKFVSNELTFIVSDQLAGDLVTTDAGQTWHSVTPAGIPVESTNHIAVRHSNNQIVLLDAIPDDKSCLFFSADLGNSWQRTPSSFYYDCYGVTLDSCNELTFHVVNEATLFTAADRFARLLNTTDGGASFVSNNESNSQYYCGSIVCAPLGTLYAQSRLSDGVIRSLDHGNTWRSIGGPPGFSDSHLICPISDNIIAAVDTFGSVWMTFNSGGDSLVTLINSDITISTEDRTVDTIGQDISLPIIISKLDKPRTVDVLVLFDSSLEYRGSFSPTGQPLDITGTQTKDRASLSIPVQQNDVISGYSRFRVFPESNPQPQVHFIPATFANGILPCGLQINTAGATSTISVPTGCGIPTISRLLRRGTFPQFQISPNPASIAILLDANQDIAEAHITLTTISGNTVYDEVQSIKKDAHVVIDVHSLTNGPYFLTISNASGESISTVVVRH